MFPEANRTDDTSHGSPKSPYSSGRFKKIVRQTAEGVPAVQSPLKLNFYKSTGSASGSFSDNLESSNQTGKSASSLNLKMYRQTVSSFLKMATRDLREPLTILKTGLAVLKRLGKDEQNEQLIEEMERALTRTTNLIGTYLELDQSESVGRLELHCEPISIRSLLQDEIRKLATIVPDEALSKVRVQNFVDKEATMWADQDKMRQVFAVLLSRAVRYSTSGGVISVEHHTNDKTEVLEISSQGRSIGAETIDALSSPFLDRTSDKLSRLDLQAARKLVEVHQGKLLFDANLLHGSRIWVILPRMG